MGIFKFFQKVHDTKYQILDTRYLLLFTLPLQLGTYFFFNFSYVNGVRIDYLAPALFLTDIVVFLLIAQHFRDVFNGLQNKRILIVLGLFLLTILGSESIEVGFYKLVKIIEIVALFLIFSKKPVHSKPFLIAFLLGAFMQLILSTAHILTSTAQQGVWYFLGERAFDISTPGIAKTAMQGVEILRPYGTFSHPNSLAGFYVLLYAFVLFWEPLKDIQSPLEKVLRGVLLAVCTLLVFLTFSKGAIITYLIITAFYSLRSIKQCVICSTSKIVIALVLAFVFLSAQGDTSTIDKRIYLTRSAVEIIAAYPFTGVGLGNYLYEQSRFTNPYPYHFLEPVHNIFLLLMSEIGIVFFVITGYFLFPFIKRVLKSDAGKAVLLTIAITGFFDHYWFTLQQNMLLLPVVFGLLQKDEV